MKSIQAHYECIWCGKASICHWKSGPYQQLPESFCVLKFAPTIHQGMWAYATSGMSFRTDVPGLELHLFSPFESDLHTELLTVIAHYHLNESSLAVGHIINFGRPWLEGSNCTRGLISLPYLDGPNLEWLETGGRRIQFLWLIPITNSEANYCKANGLESLEKLFDKPGFNYLDPYRNSLI